MKLDLVKLCAGTAVATASFINGGNFASAADIDTVYSTFETYNGNDLEMTVTHRSTKFALWSPEAEAAKV